jgi:hypothetical protein
VETAISFVSSGSNEQESKHQAAKAFLQAALASGQRAAAEVETEAMQAGRTHATLARAREDLHISSKKVGKTWIWLPPESPAVGFHSTQGSGGEEGSKIPIG